MAYQWLGTNYTYVPDYGNVANPIDNWVSWGRPPAEILGESPEEMTLRQYYLVNELLPWLNPWSRAQLTSELRGRRSQFEDAGVPTPNIGKYYGGVADPMTAHAFYQQLGPTADAVRSLADAMLKEGGDIRTSEVDWLHDVGRRLEDAIPDPGQPWTVASRRAVDAALQNIQLSAPSQEWLTTLNTMLGYVPQAMRPVDTSWFRPSSVGVRNWFS